MRVRTALTASAAVALTLVTASTGMASAAPPSGAATCRAAALKVSAAPAELPDVVRIKVTNRTTRACTVDRIPTVSFGDLDGPALPVPTADSAPQRLGGGRSAHAAVRTLDPAATQERLVDRLTVAVDPSRPGSSFDAASLGAPDGIRVWEPVTTWWLPSAAAADESLAEYTGGA